MFKLWCERGTSIRSSTESANFAFNNLLSLRDPFFSFHRSLPLKLLISPFQTPKKSALLPFELDALRALRRPGFVPLNKKKKNEDISAEIFMYSSCFEYPPNPITSCECKLFWFKIEAQLSTHSRRTCLQRIFLQLMAITVLAEIVGSSFTAHGRCE